MEEVHSYYLFPSNIFAEKGPHLVSTVLGSCISVCLYDPIEKMGGINHYMLPLWNGEGLPTPRYGNIAIDKLITRMISLGCSRRNLTAKVFGGWEHHEPASSIFAIGHRNVEVAMSMLKEHQIPLAALSVGGNMGRCIKFCTKTGEVMMKYIPTEKSRAHL